EADGQVGAESLSQAAQEGERGHGPAAFEAGDLRLLHPAPLGQLGLGQPELDAPVVDELPELTGERGRRVLHGSSPPQAAGATMVTVGSSPPARCTSTVRSSARARRMMTAMGGSSVAVSMPSMSSTSTCMRSARSASLR